MRDAFGGAFMIKLFLVFIFIYICFTAIALNYAKAFKVKNKVIDYLESKEITDLTRMTVDEQQEIEDFFDREILSGYNYSVDEESFCSNFTFRAEENYFCSPIGIIIREKTQERPIDHVVYTEGVIYTVSTYVGWNAGFLNSLLSVNGNNEQQDILTGYWKISGETRVIVRKN